MCPLPRKLACNSIGRGFNKGWKRCNSNVAKSWLEGATGELHAKLIRTRRHRHGRRPRDRRARLRCPWAVAGPGWTTRRCAQPHVSTPGPTGVEGTGGCGGPGCGARGRWRGLAGLRADAPSEARGADGSRAGRRPRAHRAARPTGQHVWRPEHQRRHKHSREYERHNTYRPKQRHSKQRGARSASAPRAPRTHACQLLTG